MKDNNLKGNLYLYMVTVWHCPLYKYVAFSSNSNKLHGKYTVQLMMHNFTLQFYYKQFSQNDFVVP